MSEPFSGSALNPRPGVVFAMIQGLRQRTVLALGDKSLDWFEAHNMYTTYVVLLMLLATGHRPVADPLPTLDCFYPEMGMVAIEDKVVDENHELRVVAAPPMVFDQLLLYLKHLKSVYLRLKASAPELALQVLAVTQHDAPRPIPLFFYFEKGGTQWQSVRPLTLRTYLGSDWKLPLNVGRHLLATIGRLAGCSPVLIDAQLGHQDVGCEPFGPMSPLSPQALSRCWGPLLQKHVEESGLVALPGWTPPRGKPVPEIGARLAAKMKIGEFGPGTRRQTRTNALERDVHVIDGLIREVAPQIAEGRIDDNRLQQLLQKIAETAPAGRFAIRIGHLRRRLAALRRAGVKVALPGRVSLAEIASSPFSAETIVRSRQLAAARLAFVDAFDKASSEPTCENRIAEILASAILFGAVLDVPRLKKLFEALRFPRLIRIENRFMLLGAAEAPELFVWQCDRISAGLVMGYLNAFSKAERESCSESGIVSALVAIAAESAWVSSRKSRHSGLEGLMRALVEPAKQYWSLRLSGIDYALATGGQKSACLPETSVVRLMTGRRVVTPDFANNAHSRPLPPDWTPAAGFDPLRHGYVAATAFWKHLRSVFYAAASGKSTKTSKKSDDLSVALDGKEDGALADRRSNRIKKRLEPELRKILNHPELYPPLGVALTHWAYVLCVDGTPTTKRIRVSTVFRYVDAIGRRLLERGGYTNFFALPDFAIEDIYADVAETACANVRHPDFVMGRLMEFHDFLVSTYGLPDIDWTDILADLPLSQKNVDAAVVSDEEYQRVFQLLKNDPEMHERERRSYAAMLALLYRFGLRPGELFLLKTADLSCEPSLVLRVCNSVYGETKSDNGVRAIPWLGNDQGEDSNLVRQWRAHALEYGNKHPLALLFAEEDNCRCVMDRSKAMRRISEALRIATGDQSLRPRHLRHSFASRLYLAMVMEDEPADEVLHYVFRKLWPDTSIEEIRRTLVGNSNISRRSLWALALALGHVSPSVSFKHYVHLMDFVLGAKLWKQETNLTQKAVARVLLCPHATVRNIRHKNKDAAARDDFLFFHFAREISGFDTSELIDLEEMPAALSSLDSKVDQEPSLEAVDRILCLAGVRDELDGLAERFLVSMETVRKIVEKARSLQNESGFADFGLDLFDEGDRFPGAKSSVRYPRLDSDSPRLRAALRLVSPDVAGAATEWLKYKDRSKTILKFESAGALERFVVTVLPAFRMNGATIDLLIPAKINDASWDSIRTRFSRLGLAIRDSFRLGGSRGAVGLRLRHGNGELKRHRNWNRMMFVIACSEAGQP